MLQETTTGEQPPVDMPELRIVLLGKTGNGKSSSGNTILGAKVFEEVLSSESVTKTCNLQDTNLKGKTITVIDTPGIFDTRMTKEELEAEIRKCVEMSAPGPHAFLLVIRLDVKYTEEEKNSVTWIRENFGEEASQYIIVLFTHGDALDGEPVDEFLERSPAFSSVIEQCGGRYHVLNNKSQEWSQVSKLLEMVEKNGRHYTSDIYEKAQRNIKLRKNIIYDDLINYHQIIIASSVGLVAGGAIREGIAARTATLVTEALATAGTEAMEEVGITVMETAGTVAMETVETVAGDVTQAAAHTAGSAAGTAAVFGRGALVTLAAYMAGGPAVIGAIGAVVGATGTVALRSAVMGGAAVIGKCISKLFR